jgi:hypothetical protein
VEVHSVPGFRTRKAHDPEARVGWGVTVTSCWSTGMLSIGIAEVLLPMRLLRGVEAQGMVCRGHGRKAAGAEGNSGA